MKIRDVELGWFVVPYGTMVHLRLTTSSYNREVRSAILRLSTVSPSLTVNNTSVRNDSPRLKNVIIDSFAQTSKNPDGLIIHQSKNVNHFRLLVPEVESPPDAVHCQGNVG